MKKKLMTVTLLALGIATGISTQIHAQSIVDVCGKSQSSIYATTSDSPCTPQRASTKRKTEAAQRRNRQTYVTPCPYHEECIGNHAFRKAEDCNKQGPCYNADSNTQAYGCHRGHH